MSHGPYAIAKDSDLGVVFIENACPGDELEAQIYDQRKDFAFANLVDLTQASSLREIEPPCKIHKICGSCQWQHIRYKEQLEFKRQNLVDLIVKANLNLSSLRAEGEAIQAGLLCRSAPRNDEIPPLLGMDKPWNYRNKIIYPVEVIKETGRIKAGYFRRNSNELINIKYCPIQYEIFDEIMNTLKEQMGSRNYPSKLIRHIMLRSNSDYSEILLCVIVRQKQLDKEFNNKLKVDLRKIQESFVQIKTVTVNYNDLSTNVILGQETEIISGEGFITETFGDIKLEISTTSFFQVNTKQFLKIIDLIKPVIKSGMKVLDLYCGIGTISLSLAKSFSDLQIKGIESVNAAIVNARRNAEINTINNAEFIEGKVEDCFEPRTSNLEPYDLVIVNPPRKGCTNKVLDSLGELKSGKIVYVSCNPATLTRDIKYLEQYDYKLKSVQGVDLFPHSFHFETVAVLTRE